MISLIILISFTIVTIGYLSEARKNDKRDKKEHDINKLMNVNRYWTNIDVK